LGNSIENYIHEKIIEKGTIHMALLDPQKTDGMLCIKMAEEAEKGGSSAIMIGGSTLASNSILDDVVKKIKDRLKIPIILFPNNLSGISPFADAIWFMSLLNSLNTYYIIDVQALSAHAIKNYGIEALPMGYIIVGEGGAAGFVGQARGIPYNHPEITLGYSLAAEMLGMRFVYLEAGSGAITHVPLKMIELVKKNISIPLIVGGGIRNGDEAKKVAKAGADIIVTGTLVEETDKIRESIYEIVSSIE
jgi:phosphoglycerol geranylgeranyltransferase